MPVDFCTIVAPPGDSEQQWAGFAAARTLVIAVATVLIIVFTLFSFGTESFGLPMSSAVVDAQWEAMQGSQDSVVSDALCGDSTDSISGSSVCDLACLGSLDTSWNSLDSFCCPSFLDVQFCDFASINLDWLESESVSTFLDNLQCDSMDSQSLVCGSLEDGSGSLLCDSKALDLEGFATDSLGIATLIPNLLVQMGALWLEFFQILLDEFLAFGPNVLVGMAGIVGDLIGAVIQLGLDAISAIFGFIEDIIGEIQGMFESIFDTLF
jgi:hypothetical protein